MSVTIVSSGLQTTLQDLGRPGLRHLGIPSSGAADRLSSALANRLVGNEASALTIEITLTGAKLKFNNNGCFAVVGAQTDIELNGVSVQADQSHRYAPGDTLSLGRSHLGCRAYLAVAGGFIGDEFLGSSGTYLPAGIGGFQGRALTVGDQVDMGQRHGPGISLCEQIRPAMTKTWTLRVTVGAEFEWLSAHSQQALFAHGFKMGRRADRMGGVLDGPALDIAADPLPSCPVFPGTVQCPPSGTPFLLMADAQTTGGYPRIAQVIRADRHFMGQIRPGDRVRLWQVDIDTATETLWEKNRRYEQLDIPARVF